MSSDFAKLLVLLESCLGVTVMHHMPTLNSLPPQVVDCMSIAGLRSQFPEC